MKVNGIFVVVIVVQTWTARVQCQTEKNCLMFVERMKEYMVE